MHTEDPKNTVMSPSTAHTQEAKDDSDEIQATQEAIQKDDVSSVSAIAEQTHLEKHTAPTEHIEELYHSEPKIDEPTPSTEDDECIQADSGKFRTSDPKSTDIPVDGSMLNLIELLLKDRDSLFKVIQERTEISKILPGLLSITLVGMLLVGGILGTYTGGWQIVYVACKLPLLLLLTLAVCHCSFWTWGQYFRTRLKASQVAALTLASIATMSLLVLGLSPFIWLAMGDGMSSLLKLTQTAQEFHYNRAVITLVVAFGIAGLGGVHVLYQGLQKILSKPSERTGGTQLMACIWIGMYGFVGLQMSWLLRPYLFHPWANGRPLTLLREIDGNVYASVVKILIRLIVGN